MSTTSTRQFCQRLIAERGSSPTGSPNSTRAYQGAAGNLPPEFVASLERLTVGPNRPNLTLILDLDPEVGLKRAAARRQTAPADRFESEGLPFHKTLRRAFLDIAATEPLRCVVIDADGSEDEVDGDARRRRLGQVMSNSQRPRPESRNGLEGLRARRRRQGVERLAVSGSEPRSFRMNQPPEKAETDDLPEADALTGAPHPRHVYSLVGHERAEAEMLSAYREGRLAHAWLIGGREGIGKATLAWRFARFVLANPDPAAKAVREAPNLDVAPTHQAARLLAGLAHPDFALIRREWQAASKRLASEISVDVVRQGLQVFQLSAAFGGWRIAIVDSAEDLNRNSANALLKMVEEPPQRSLILIVSHRPGQILPTIRSRCRRLRLDPLSEDEIVRAATPSGRPGAKPAAMQSRSPPSVLTDRFARRSFASRPNRKGRPR